MHDKSIRLSDPQGLEIRTIAQGDLENLRSWKNAHRMFFFHHEEIQSAQQLQWHASYLERVDDYMFIVEAEGRAIGCMGIRLLVDGWDVYNVILGATELAGRGLMGRAFQLMLGFARERQQHSINLKVLKQNPAIGWYQKNGFQITADGGDHLLMRHSVAPTSKA